MMRPLQLAAIGAFRIGGGCETVMGPAHVPLRRRRFSFGHRHGGNSLGPHGESKRCASKGRARPSGGAGKNKARSEQESAAGFKP